ncbi:MAG: hypothetical protein GXO48_00250 [Chlorobi bacterium]|nr:hypothetical protein [Chlorobiota bacterium]
MRARKIILKVLALSLGLIPDTYAQGVGIGTTSPHPSARLDIYSQSQGFLIPRLSISERDNISNPAHSLLIFNIETFCLEAYDSINGVWLQVSCPSACSPCDTCPLPVIDSIRISGVTCPGDTVKGVLWGSRGNVYVWTPPSGWLYLGGRDSALFVGGFEFGWLYAALCNECGCILDSVFVAIGNAPISVSITSSYDSVCKGDTFTVVAQGSSSTTYYQWTVSNGLVVVGSSTSDSITLVGTLDGSYVISVRACNGCGCSSESYDTLVVWSSPLSVSLTGPHVVCVGDTVKWKASCNGCSSYNWQYPPGWTLLQSAVDSIVLIPNTTDGHVKITVQGSGCAFGSDSLFIQADSCNSFCMAIGGPNNDEGYSIDISPTGSFVVAGKTNSFGVGGYDNYLVHLDHMGNVMWDHTFGSTGNDYVHGMDVDVIAYNSQIIVSGEYGFQGGGLIYSVDYNGNTKWGKRISAWMYSGGVVEYTPDKVIIGGYTWWEGPSALYVVDTAGNGLAGYKYPASCGSTPQVLMKITKIGNNGYMGTIYGRCPSAYRPSIVYIDTSLQMIRGREFIISSPSSLPGYGIAMLDDKSACATLGYGLSCVDTSANVLLNLYFPNNDIILSGVVVTPRKTIIAVGWTSGLSQFGNEDAFLMEVDTQGNVLRAVVIGGAGNDRFYNVTLDASGHLVLVGWTTSFGSGNKDVYLVHLKGSWSLSCPTNCSIAPVTPTIATSISSRINSFTRSVSTGIQTNGQSSSGTPSSVKCP